LSGELDFNLMFSQRGHLTLAHSDRAMNTMQERAEVNQLLGIDSRVVYPDEIARLCPQLDVFKAAPIVGTTLAELVATGKTPRLIAPFSLERFHTDTLVSELAAAAVSH
jgi:glycine/D-amino acid oxidase-like deaminating enzyme